MKRIVPAVNGFVRERIGRLAALVNQKSGGTITPDEITVLSLAGHFPLAILIALDYPFLAALLLLFFGLFDVLDGELARLQKSASKKGMVFDAATDRIKETLIFSAVAYNISQSAYVDWAFLAALALGGGLSVSYAKAKAEVALAMKKPKLGHHAINRFFSEGFISFEIRMFIIFAGLVSGQLFLATVIVAGLAAVAMFERLIVYLDRT